MKKTVAFGEIMLRLSTPDALRFSQAQSFDSCLGGSEANVAVSLSQLGACTEFVTCLPENDLAQTAIDQLSQLGVGVDNINRSGDRMGTYFLESGASLRATKVVYDRRYSSMDLSKTGMISWGKVFENAEWLHWSGITPAISEGAAKLCLEGIEIAKSLGLKVSVDLNMRHQMWKWGKSALDVMPEMVEKCDVILGNGEAFEEMMGVSTNGLSDEAGCDKVHAAYPNLKSIAFTKREIVQFDRHKWQGFLWSNGKLHTSRLYDIGNVIDRIGSGDAFMASLIYALLNFNDTQKVVDFATAGGAYKHSIKGDFNLASADEVEALSQGTNIRIKR